MSDSNVYAAGDTIAAEMLLEAHHEVPSCIWLTLSLEADPAAEHASPAENRATSLTLETSPSMSDPVDPNQTTFPLHSIVPKHVIGGTYRAASVTFFMPDGRQVKVLRADPRGEFVRHIANDAPAPYDIPVISGLS